MIDLQLRDMHTPHQIAVVLLGQMRALLSMASVGSMAGSLAFGAEELVVTLTVVVLAGKLCVDDINGLEGARFSCLPGPVR